MLPNDIRSLTEAYLSIYDSEENSFEEEMLSEETLLFEAIEELHNDEVEEIVEETIYNMLDEGYDFDEIEEVFEDIFSEARIDMAARAAQRQKDRASSEKAAKEARSRGAAVVRKEKRAETVAKVKGAVKGVLSRVKGAVKSAAAKAKEAGKEAKFQAVDKPAAQYAAQRKLHPAPGLAARAKDPAKRRALRSAVAKDITSRAVGKVKAGVEKAKTAVKQAKSAVKQKAASAAVSGYAAGKMAQKAVTSAPGKAKEAAASAAGKAREAGSAAKAGVKKGIRGAALSVARSMREEYDAYDLVLEYLIDMGHAETVSEANYIMTQMDEQTIQDIIESQLQ